MTSIRIRGIYTTALTKFFIDRGYMINQMSDTMRERFPENETHDVPTVDIKHTRDLQGISLVGSREALDQISTDLTSSFVDVFTLRSSIDLYGIYKGSIIKTNNETIVNLGTDIGILPEPTNEDEVLVQVLEMNEKPILTTRITFSGEYSVIIPEDDIKISRKIRDDTERERLTAIGRKVKPQSFGVLWRTSSEYVDEDILVAEARDLSKNADFVMEKYDNLDGPGLIKEGKSHMKIIFGSQAKHHLDEVRNTVVPTIRQHHMLKSAGRDISFAVDVIEKIKAEREIHDIDGLFHSIFRHVKGPKVGDDLTLEHVKPSSHTVFMEGAKVKRYAPPYIKLKRYMAPRGYYDGLDIRKDQGDYCITEMEEGAWHFKHTYYNRNNEEKGEYFNICTPIEIFPTKIRYIDLEVDVVRFPDGESRIIDEEHLNKRVDEGIFSDTIAAIAMREANMIINSYESEML